MRARFGGFFTKGGTTATAGNVARDIMGKVWNDMKPTPSELKAGDHMFRKEKRLDDLNRDEFGVQADKAPSFGLQNETAGNEIYKVLKSVIKEVVFAGNDDEIKASPEKRFSYNSNTTKAQRAEFRAEISQALITDLQRWHAGFKKLEDYSSNPQGRSVKSSGQQAMDKAQLDGFKNSLVAAVKMAGAKLGMEIELESPASSFSPSNSG